jgi:arabinose-5-phosphate isomerase
MERARSLPLVDDGRQHILADGRDAVLGEAQALFALANSLDVSFPSAVLAMAYSPGRVVVSGLGKSGHVARKIAATLSATGLPALFIHAADAAHGDLGALVAGDVVLVLSKSGETAECAALAAHARRLKCQVIAMTGHAGSSLARAADLVLVIPDLAEVCPFGTSPTSSTAMMLALGDALAVASMRHRGVSREALRALHPAGRSATT